MIVIILLLFIAFGLAFAGSYLYLSKLVLLKNQQITPLYKLFFSFVFANSNVILLSLLFEILNMDRNEHRDMLWRLFSIEFTFMSYYIIPLMLLFNILHEKGKLAYLPHLYVGYLLVSNVIGKYLKWMVALSPDALPDLKDTFFNFYFSYNYLMEYLTFLGSTMTAILVAYGEIQGVASEYVYPMLSEELIKEQKLFKKKIEELGDEISLKQNRINASIGKGGQANDMQLTAVSNLQHKHDEMQVNLSLLVEKTSPKEISYFTKLFGKIMGGYGLVHFFISFFFLFFSDYYDYSMMLNKKKNNYIDTILLTTFSVMGSDTSREQIELNINYKRIERYLSIIVVGIQLVTNMNSFLKYIMFIYTKLLKKYQVVVNDNTQLVLLAYCVTLFYVVSSVFVIFSLPLPYRIRIKDMYETIDFALLVYYFDKTYFVFWIIFGIFEIGMHLSIVQELSK